MSTTLELALPVPALLSTGGTVSLTSLLNAAFGVGNFNFSNYYLYDSSSTALSSEDFSYWNLSAPSVSQWFLNGAPITPDGNTSTRVSPAQLGSVVYEAGDDIEASAYLTVPIAFSGNIATEYAQYYIPYVAPGLMSTTASAGDPTPADVVAAAQRYAGFYGSPYNDNDCHNIAESVAAAAGASLPGDSGSLDPTQNVSGGFWRVVYRGTDADATASWQTLVQPGDIVRMAWAAGGEHTTTVLGKNADGTLEVYDNGDNGDYIGVHSAKYDSRTIESSVTIYRLTTDDLYLINGSALSETLDGTTYNDSIAAGDGDDLLSGGIGNDVLDGGNGNDTFVGGTGSDTFLGGAGLNIVDYGQEWAQGGYQGAAVDLLDGIAKDTFGGYDTLSNINSAVGTPAADSFYGTNSADTFSGAAGNDQIVGWAGDDSIDGGDGDDVLLGNAGADTLTGGNGNDWLWCGDGSDSAAGGAGDDVLVGDLGTLGESGNDTLVGGLGGDILIGGPGNDLLIGGNDTTMGADGGVNWMIGGAGADTYYGTAGNDIIWEQLDSAESGNDTVFAGAGDDLILTGLGDDVINAGAGNDTIYGGAGADTIATGTGDDQVWFTGVGDAGDTITDFIPAMDKLVIYPLLNGALSTVAAFADGIFSLAASGANTALFYDADGTAGPDGAITLATLDNLSPANFNITRDFI